MALKVPILDYYEWQKAVLDKDLSDPPGSPSVGDRYIISTTASGAWLNKENYIAEFHDNIWNFTTPRQGMLTLVSDEGVLYQYIDNAWKDFALVIGKRRVTASTGKIITIDECGKVFTTSQNAIFTLPVTTSSDIGIHYTFVRIDKLTTLTINVPGTDKIADSQAGGSIYSSDSEENVTSLTLMLVAVGQWGIMSGHGTWSVT